MMSRIYAYTEWPGVLENKTNKTTQTAKMAGGVATRLKEQYIYVLAPPPKPMFLSAGVQLVSIFVHLTMYYKNVQIHKVMCLLNSSWME